MSQQNDAPTHSVGPNGHANGSARLTLVTGATGLVGNNVVRLLCERGECVRVIARNESDPRPLAGLPLERVAGDIRDRDSVRAAMQGVDRVVHSAGYVHIGWARPDLHESINVEGTRNVAEEARSAGARMVHVSTVDTLGFGTLQAPATEETAPDRSFDIPYVVTKREAEKIVLHEVERGLDAVIVNPVFVLGPWDWKPSSGRLLLSGKRLGVIMAPRGANDFCDARDVAEGMLAALELGRRGARYILGGEPLSYLQAFRLFSQVKGSMPPFCRLGPMMVIVGGWGGDQIRRITGREPSINSAATKMSAAKRHFSYARAQQELGYRPRPMSETVRDAWRWFVEHGYTR